MEVMQGWVGSCEVGWGGWGGVGEERRWWTT